jgi:hypothetical protein
MADEQVLGMHYFDHQFLRQADFETAQHYHVDRLRQHNRLLHLPGIVQGLQVTGTINTRVVQVTLGRAVDETHHEVILRQTADPEVPPLLRVQTATGFQESEQHITGTALTLDLTSVPTSSRPNNAVFITLRQGTKETNRSQDPGTTDNNTRLVERAVIEASTSSPTGAQLLLAEVNRNADGTIQNVDLTERVLAGAWLADGSVTRPKLAPDVVTSDKIAEADGTSDQRTNIGTGVKEGHLQNNAVSAGKLRAAVDDDGARAVTTNHIRNNAVTSAKIAADTIQPGNLHPDLRSIIESGGGMLFYTKLQGELVDFDRLISAGRTETVSIAPAGAFFFVSVSVGDSGRSIGVAWRLGTLRDEQVVILENPSASPVTATVRAYVLTEPPQR